MDGDGRKKERKAMWRVLAYLNYKDLREAAEASADWSIGIHEFLTKRVARMREEEEGIVALMKPIGKLESREDSNRWDDLTELLDKSYQGLDVWAEHQARRIRARTRADLEIRLVEGVREGLDEVRKTCLEYESKRGDGTALDSEHVYLRFLMSRLDGLYGELHVNFLTGYLNYPEE